MPPLSPSLLKQIEAEAKPAAQSRYRFPLTEYGEGGMNGYEKGYIAGATAYAHYKEEAERLARLLRYVRGCLEQEFDRLEVIDFMNKQLNPPAGDNTKTEL